MFIGVTVTQEGLTGCTEMPKTQAKLMDKLKPPHRIVFEGHLPVICLLIELVHLIIFFYWAVLANEKEIIHSTDGSQTFPP